jgi:hypothetical protein
MFQPLVRNTYVFEIRDLLPAGDDQWLFHLRHASSDRYSWADDGLKAFIHFECNRTLRPPVMVPTLKAFRVVGHVSENAWVRCKKEQGTCFASECSSCLVYHMH